jgi:hypothetical protein
LRSILAGNPVFTDFADLCTDFTDFLIRAQQRLTGKPMRRKYKKIREIRVEMVP